MQTSAGLTHSPLSLLLVFVCADCCGRADGGREQDFWYAKSYGEYKDLSEHLNLASAYWLDLYPTLYIQIIYFSSTI